MSRKYLSFILFILIVACSEEDQYVESSIDNFVKSQTSFALLDTFSVNMETIIIDSIGTSSTGTLLTGKYDDPELGPTESKAYFELTPPSGFDLAENEEYDSLVLVLNYGDLVYGDTLQTQTIWVKQLLEEMEESDDGGYYNTTEFNYSDDALGELIFIAKPFKNQELTIKMSDALGVDLFNKLKDDADEVSSSEDFREFFKGLVLEGGEENTAVLSFLADTSACLVLHTHISEESRRLQSYEFSMGASGNYFNHIEADRSTTVLSDLSTQRESISSSQLGDKAFIQGGTGIITRINFPSLDRLLEMDTKNLMYKAELILKPYPGSEDVIDLPSSLVLYYTDKYNNLVSQVTDSDDEVISASLYYDEFYHEGNYYVLDITDPLYSELSDGFIDSEIGMILTIPTDEIKGSLSRLVLDARSDIKYRPVLNLYYMFFE